MHKFEIEKRIESAIGSKLWVGITGKGPTMILCDGLGCDGYVWKHFIPAFRHEFQLVRWNYRGHGRSEIPEDLDAMSIENAAEDLFLVLNAIGVEKAILVGHSMGVQVILETALLDIKRKTERIKGLVTLCGAPGYPLDSFKNTSAGRHLLPYIRQFYNQFPKIIEQIWFKIVLSRLTLFVAKYWEINHKLMSVDDLRPYFAGVVKIPLGAFLSIVEQAAKHDTTNRLEQILIPVLVVAGELDSFTPSTRSVTMAQRLSESAFFLLPQASHSAPLEWPDLLHLRMRRFFRRHKLMD